MSKADWGKKGTGRFFILKKRPVPLSHKVPLRGYESPSCRRKTRLLACRTATGEIAFSSGQISWMNKYGRSPEEIPGLVGEFGFDLIESARQQCCRLGEGRSLRRESDNVPEGLRQRIGILRRAATASGRSRRLARSDFPPEGQAGSLIPPFLLVVNVLLRFPAQSEELVPSFARGEGNWSMLPKHLVEPRVKTPS